MSYQVGVISEEIAIELNEGLNDDEKLAFQNADGTEFYIQDPDTYPPTIPSSKYAIKTITQSVVDGSLPYVKKRRVYP